ncbi:uncharacterized protein LOC128743328 [Sabethes cyaneus]|uniref:uncharacterized protein LOC128743328 n=1 Tax=Sabethes cyaneus TaxID=53552 RepID=UPI00237E7C63|nr:uncharacterized protein LOC128743328 [Sabethes cyaneus]
MTAPQLPPEIWDRIFDYLPFQQQLEKAVVCRAWNARIVWKASLVLSCPSHYVQNHIDAIRHSLRNYRSFMVHMLKSDEDYTRIQLAIQECKEKFAIQKLFLYYTSSKAVQRLVDEHFEWISTVQCLHLQLCDDESFPAETLSKLVKLRELRLLNITDTNANWTMLWNQLSLIRSVTLDAAWHYNDAALRNLVDAVSECSNLTELTLRSNGSNDTTAELSSITKKLTNLKKLSLVRLTIRINDVVLQLPELTYLNLGISWFVFDKPCLTINAPKLQFLRVSKNNIPFVKFAEGTNITQMELYGHSMSWAHSSFSTVKRLQLTIQEPANQEVIEDEIKLFPIVDSLVIKLLSKECTMLAPAGNRLLHLKKLHLNNFVLHMIFFEEIAQMKLLQSLTIEECNFFLERDVAQVDLSHLCCFRVKRVSLPMFVERFPIIAEGQPPVVLVDRLRTHLWRNDHFNVFSSKW